MELTETGIGNRRCLCRLKENVPVILLGAMSPADETAEGLLRTTEGLSGFPEYSLLVYEVKDWFSDFSPWPAQTQRASFGGNGKATLAWLEQFAIPYLKDKRCGQLFLSGYSLAGLFSLWCMSQSSLFDGFLSCSGSLWYPGWNEYMHAAAAKKECRVYLSLGDREKNTRDPDMKQVEDRTRVQYEILRQDPLVRNSVFIMEPGGHFRDSDKRLANGIRWAVDGI